MGESLSVLKGNLAETGRLHFFYHCSDSVLPIRDVTDTHGAGRKTEPHIEIGAENWCSGCWQPNIRGFIQSQARYLFLYTKCSHPRHQCFGKLYVVGYVEKREVRQLARGGNTWFAVRGPTRIVAFDDAYPLGGSCRNPRHIRRILNATETAAILRCLRGSKDITRECIEEIRRLDPQKQTCSVSHCSHRHTDCLRYAYPGQG